MARVPYRLTASPPHNIGGYRVAIPARGMSELPLLPRRVDDEVEPNNVYRSNNSSRIRDLSLGSLSIIALVVIACIITYGWSPGSDGAGSVWTERMDMQMLPSVFGGPDEFHTQNTRDGPISFLDRQIMDCKAEALNGFQMTHTGEGSTMMIGFDYSCIGMAGHNMIKAETLKTYPTSPNKGAGGLGSHKVVCPENTVMTKWNGMTDAGRFFIAYNCKTYDVASYSCKDLVTTYAPAGPVNSLVYLDRHKVQCGGDEAVRGWWGQLTNDQLRLHYTCCKATPHSPTALPSPVPTTVPSNKPLAEPTFFPTPFPTTAPTVAPTADGTIAPSALSTEKPTLLPSTPPTVAPTVEPSKGPTMEPSYEPSMEPSSEPLAAPSPEPTLEPTPRPTMEPTITFRPTSLEPTMAPVYPTPEPTGINYKPADLCGFVYSKTTKSNVPPKGCALFVKHNLDWLNDEQSSPAFYACASNEEDVKITESDLRNNGLVNKDGSTMLTTIIPGSGTLVTFFSLDKFEGLQHTYTDEWHPELSKFHFSGTSAENLKLKREHVKSAIVKSAASSKDISKMPHGWCHN